jgi:flagellar motor switch protein FliN
MIHSTPNAAPAYSQSLLRIKVPVTVTLAAKRESLEHILQLGKGSILQFEKPCDHPLDLEVNGRRLAVGKAVQIGPHLGLQVATIVPPGEQFVPLK